MKVRVKELLEAHFWHKNGDHPRDESEWIRDSDGKPLKTEGKIVRRFRVPDRRGSMECPNCAFSMVEHGFIESENSPGGHEGVVCPGNVIITYSTGKFRAITLDEFENIYEVVEP